MAPKALVLDIETSPILSYVWQLWDQNVGLNQIVNDWCVIAWAAKWLGSREIFYRDQRNAKNIEDDREILEEVWKLMDEADILITQNGKSFDAKKLNARFILNGMNPPSSYRHIDTKILAKRHFAFTSNKLEYMTDKICKKKKKSTHKKYPGFELWRECLKGNLDAWKEMEKYNKQDVLSLEELYKAMIPWDSSINFSVYEEDSERVCSCGSKDFASRGYVYTNSGKYHRLKCKKCFKEIKCKLNLFNKEKRSTL